RVPSIVSFPKIIPAGEVREQMATGCDWLPTIADYCQVPSPERKLDGRSLKSVIASADAERPHDRFFCQLGRGSNAQWVIREGDWKLLGNPQDRSDTAPLTEDDRLFLVNLADDVGERTNLVRRHPEIVSRLQTLHEDYLADIGNE